MPAVTLDEAKAHLNILDDGDDSVISQKVAAAQAHIERLLGFALAVEFSASVVPEDLRQAVLLLAAHWYENREATLVGVTAQELPFGLWDILREYREYSFDV